MDDKDDKDEEDKIQLPNLSDLESDSADNDDIVDSDVPDDPADIKIEDVIADVAKTDDPTSADTVPDDSSKKATKGSGFKLPSFKGLVRSDGDHKIKLPGILLIVVGIFALAGIMFFVLRPQQKTTPKTDKPVATQSSVSSSSKKTATVLSQSNPNKILSAPTDNQTATTYSEDTIADRYTTLEDAMTKKENLNIFYHNAILRYATGKTNSSQFAEEVSPILGQLDSLYASIPTSYKDTDDKTYRDTMQAISSLSSSIKAAGSMSVENAVNEFNTSTNTQASLNSQFFADASAGMTKHQVKFIKTTDKKGGTTLKITR